MEQNVGRGAKSDSSSLSLATKSRLRDKLRRLDKRITKLDRWLYLQSFFVGYERQTQKLREERRAKDAERRETRKALKRHTC